MASKTSKSAERRARIEEMRQAERARDRRNRILTITAVAAVVAATIGGGYLVVSTTQDDEQTQVDEQAENGDQSEDGEQSEEELAQKEAAAPEGVVRGDLGRDHTEEDVDYPMSPAAGGDHSSVWVDCQGSVYDEEIPEENAVHALEHGAVWITYSEEAAEADVTSLGDRVSQTPYTLLSPYSDQSSPITLTAWGHQLGVDRASDPRVNEFLEEYVQGEQTPEPGATCASELAP
jgi:hypothetical protein